MGHRDLAAAIDPPSTTSAACSVGYFHGLSARRLPLVSLDGSAHLAREGRTAVSDFWSAGGVDAGSRVVLQFENGDLAWPIVVGILREPPSAPLPVGPNPAEGLCLQAGQKLELVCGRSSIVLSADGKIVIKGTNLISRSSGPNKIRGATVAIN